ncbi:MAG: alpha/beta fold hydrolase [Thermodesulfobacteriota bacterium]
MQKKPGYMIAGNGTPVVFLHCSMSTKEQWLKIFNSLKNSFTVIAIDLYGYGQSPFPEKFEGFSLDHETKAMESVLDETIGPDTKFHLVGHSYGGAAAMKYSAGKNSRNLSLCVYEPMLNHVFRETDKEMYYLGKEFIGDIEQSIINGNPEQGCIKFIDLFSGDGTFERLPEEIKNIFIRCIKKMPMDYKATIADDLSLDLYKNIKIPTCIISGEQSPDLTADISKAVAGVVPHCFFHKVKGGHMAPIEKPDNVNKIIENFLVSSEQLVV